MTMRVVQLTVILAQLPLRLRIKHAGATYRSSENLFVCCQLSDGTVGWGEGIPREKFLGFSARQLWDYFWRDFAPESLAEPCRRWGDVLSLCESLYFRAPSSECRSGWEHPLRCALELAILDAFGRAWGEPVSAALREFPPAATIFSPRKSVQYSATILRGDPLFEVACALAIRLSGFRHCKVKVGTESTPTREVRRVKRLRRFLGRAMDLRVDANGAWTLPQARDILAKLAGLSISCVEDPVAVADLPALKQLRAEISIPIMLDEYIVSCHDLEQAVHERWCDLINIRISKCGGLLRSSKMAALASRGGLGFQLGCHPGESGILSAAGRHFATTFAGMRYVEGSFDRFLFRRLITQEDITFSRGGWAPALERPGLGITVLRSRLAPYILRQRTVRLL